MLKTPEERNALKTLRLANTGKTIHNLLYENKKPNLKHGRNIISLFNMVIQNFFNLIIRL